MRRKKLGLCEPHAEDHRAERGEYCAHETCNRGHIKGGYCGSHYSQKQRGQELTGLGERQQSGPVECGTSRMYGRGCRCAECKEAKRLEMRDYMAKYEADNGESYWTAKGRAGRKRTTYDRVCIGCGAGFQTRTVGTEYCTHSCAMGARAATPGYYGDGSCLTCGATYQKTGATQEYCTPACYPRPPASEPADLRSPLRKGYEDNNKELFFDALKADCDVDETTGCWSWARQEANGYARTRFGKKEIALHRASLEMKHGKPLGVLAAHHTCANTLCVNPEHLQPATAAENNLEMNARKSFIARIAELENALKEIEPDHEILKRVSAI